MTQIKKTDQILQNYQESDLLTSESFKGVRSKAEKIKAIYEALKEQANDLLTNVKINLRQPLEKQKTVMQHLILRGQAEKVLGDHEKVLKYLTNGMITEGLKSLTEVKESQLKYDESIKQLQETSFFNITHALTRSCEILDTMISLLN